MSVSSIGGSSSLQAMQQLLFNSLDTNQDGQISADEFSALGQSAPSDTGQTSHTGDASASDRIGGDTLSSLIAAQAQSRFDAADTNGDGELSADELAAKLPAGDSQKAADFLKKADTNGDGSLSESEFAAAMPKHGHGHHMHFGGPPPTDSTDAASATATASATSTAGSTTASADGSSSGGSDSSAKNPADTNGDGVVSASEMMAYLQGASSTLTSSVSDLMKSFLNQLDSLGAASSSSSTSSVTA